METFTKDKSAYIQRVREARQNTPYTQAEMAELIGVDRPTYTNYEIRRAMPQRYIAKFCKAAGVNADWLLRGIGPMEEGGEQHDDFFDDVKELWDSVHAQNKKQVVAFMKALLKEQAAKKPSAKPVKQSQAKTRKPKK